jgi:glycosyltransferase involved in cell wall biosynthesis
MRPVGPTLPRVESQPAASLVITSKNRKEELRAALRSVLCQTVQPEVIVIDDGSTDGTPDMVRAEFPEATLHRFDQSRGLIVRRNNGALLAQGKVIFSIDDDAAFSTPRVLEQTLAEFDSPRIGAVAMPYIEPQKGNRVLQRAPSRDGLWVTDTFIGTAHALRRDLFLKLGGYREHFIHQGEEPDYCIRMLSAGYLVRLGRADVIYHYESPSRDFRRMDFFGRRNDLLFAWHNVPSPYLPLHLCGTTINGIISAARAGRFARMFKGVITGYGECVRHWHDRRPVPTHIYRLSRKLKKAGPLLLGDIEPLLPPIVAAEDFGTWR